MMCYNLNVHYQGQRVNEIRLRFRQLNGLHRYYRILDQAISTEIMLMRRGAGKDQLRYLSQVDGRLYGFSYVLNIA